MRAPSKCQTIHENGSPCSGWVLPADKDAPLHCIDCLSRKAAALRRMGKDASPYIEDMSKVLYCEDELVAPFVDYHTREVCTLAEAIEENKEDGVAPLSTWCRDKLNTLVEIFLPAGASAATWKIAEADLNVFRLLMVCLSEIFSGVPDDAVRARKVQVTKKLQYLLGNRDAVDRIAGHRRA